MYSRRTFLHMLGITSCATLFPVASFAQHTHNIYEETRLLMGTFVHIKAEHTHKDAVEAAFAKTFAMMHELEELFTRHTSSLITHLNAHKSLTNAPQACRELITHALRIEHMTGHAFNPSVLPLLEYMENTRDFSAQEVHALLPCITKNAMSIHNNTISLHPNARITLDGIAKGYIVDKACAVLEACHIDTFLINAGGDMRAKGMKERGTLRTTPWHVAIEDPQKQEKYPAVIPLYNAALATSGGYEKYFAHNVHHIILPWSRKSTTADTHCLSPSIKSLSVIAPTATQADALATGLSCMPVQQALAYINAQKELACFIIDAHDSIHTTNNWGVI